MTADHHLIFVQIYENFQLGKMNDLYLLLCLSYSTVQKTWATLLLTPFLIRRQFPVDGNVKPRCISQVPCKVFGFFFLRTWFNCCQWESFCWCQNTLFFNLSDCVIVSIFNRLTWKNGNKLSVFCNRPLVTECLKIQFKIGSVLRCLLCVDTTLLHPFCEKLLFIIIEWFGEVK